MASDASDLLTPEELAERWHVTPETLRFWRYNGKTPPYMKINGPILYRFGDILQFEKECLRRHTADNVLVNGVEGKMEA